MARFSVLTFSLVGFLVSAPLSHAQTVYPSTGFSGPISKVRTTAYGFGHQKVRGHSNSCGDCTPCASQPCGDKWSLWSDFCHVDRGCGIRSCGKSFHCCDTGCGSRIGHCLSGAKPCGHASRLWDNFCCEPRTYSFHWPHCGRRCRVKGCDTAACCETPSCETDCCDAGCGRLKGRAHHLFSGGLKSHRHGHCGCGVIVESHHDVEMQIEVEPSDSDAGTQPPVPQPTI